MSLAITHSGQTRELAVTETPTGAVAVAVTAAAAAEVMDDSGAGVKTLLQRSALHRWIVIQQIIIH